MDQLRSGVRTCINAAASPNPLPKGRGHHSLLGAAGGVQALLVELLDSGIATITRCRTGYRRTAALGDAGLGSVMRGAMAMVSGCLGGRGGNGGEKQAGDGDGKDARHYKLLYGRACGARWHRTVQLSSRTPVRAMPDARRSHSRLRLLHHCHRCRPARNQPPRATAGRAGPVGRDAVDPHFDNTLCRPRRVVEVCSVVDRGWVE